MKKSEMISLVASMCEDHDYDSPEEMAEDILSAIEAQGVLPPINTCKIIPDGKGGFKHSPTERKWDDEEV